MPLYHIEVERVKCQDLHTVRRSCLAECNFSGLNMNRSDHHLVVNTESLYCKRGRENTGVSLYRKKTALLIYSFKPLMWTQSRLIRHTGTRKPGRKEKNKTHKPKQRNKHTNSLDFSLLPSHSLNANSPCELLKRKWLEH